MMKGLSRLVALVAILGAPAAALARDATATFAVKGWHCSGCSNRTAAALKKVDGVKKVDTDADKGQVFVAFDDSKTSAQALANVIKDAGYEATPKK
jgi:mercuric transport protein